MDKRSRPMIGKISKLLLSGSRATVMDVVMSPRSPLELKTLSPRGVKNYDLGGVGLGILVALDKTGDGGSEILAKYTTSSPRSTRSDPIAVNFVKNCTGKYGNCFDELETDSMEDYTYVTCHGGPKNNSFTRVYCEKGEYGRAEHDERRSFNRKSNKTSGCIFSLSPTCTDDRTAFPATDFLRSCQLCKKNLHGKDIYIYRGEKAFCSSECRQRQITIDDDRKELCRSEASRSMDVSNSPYTPGLIFTTTILAI